MYNDILNIYSLCSSCPDESITAKQLPHGIKLLNCDEYTFTSAEYKLISKTENFSDCRFHCTSYFTDHKAIKKWVYGRT